MRLQSQGPPLRQSSLCLEVEVVEVQLEMLVELLVLVVTGAVAIWSLLNTQFICLISKDLILIHSCNTRKGYETRGQHAVQLATLGGDGGTTLPFEMTGDFSQNVAMDIISE
jgi:hypothetical protein